MRQWPFLFVRVDMTDNDILALEEETCFALGLEPLAEAGGFVSWLKRTFSNVDNDVVQELQYDLAQVKTREDRDTLLREIDKFLIEAENARRDGTFGDILTSLGLGSIGGLMGAVGGAAVGAVNASKMQAPVLQRSFWGKMPLLSKIHDAKQAAVTAAHKAAQFGEIVDKTTRGLAVASISVSLVAFTFKTVNRYSGRLDDYIDALRALRSQIVALEVSHG